jgi:hypothetical protein
VVANTATTSRTATITVGGQVHSVTQAGATAACTFALAPPASTFSASGGPGSVRVTTTAGCAWTAVSGASWVTVSTPDGTGTTDIAYVVAANTTTTPRTATIIVNGQSHTITQAAAVAQACEYSLVPAEATFGPGRSASSVRLTTDTACPWTAVSTVTWVSIDNAAGVGPSDITYDISPAMGNTRTGAVMVAGRLHTIRQNGTGSAP